jgi:copper chaperone
MTVLIIPDMHCEHCVARITNALSDAGMKFEVSLENKTVSIIEGDVAAAISELDDLGFDAAQA